MVSSRNAKSGDLKIAVRSCTNSVLVWSFFFFQAEDGIRDLTVTGVQTCALPISKPFLARVGRGWTHQTRARNGFVSSGVRRKQLRGRGAESNGPLARRKRIGLSEIGRASCRERV